MADTSPTVTIVYGLNEGPYMGRRLRAALRAAGHTITSDLQAADVIIAHSGGCFVLGTPRPSQRIIMIGLPYWPGHSIIGSLARKVWGDIKTHHRGGEMSFWAHKTFWNAVYFWNMRRNIAMLAGRKKGTVWQYRNVTVIRYSHDPICTPNLTSLPFVHRPRFVELPGQHDDCWRSPGPVVRSIQS